MLKEFPVTIEKTLSWGDMDAFSHVNNTKYFRFFEDARIAYFQKTCIIDEMAKTKIGPILKSTSCTFRLPLTFPDTLSIGAKVVELKNDRFVMKYELWSHRHQRLAAEGEGVIVCLDYSTGQKAPLPERVVHAIKQLEKI